MTEQEKKVLDLLGSAVNAFGELPEMHQSDRPEFVGAIHAAQNIVLARSGLRELRGSGVRGGGKSGS